FSLLSSFCAAGGRSAPLSFPSRRSSDLRVAEIMEAPGEFAADAGAPAGDEDRVACCLHGRLLRSNVSVWTVGRLGAEARGGGREDRKSTRLNSSHVKISHAVFCLRKKRN